MLQFRLTESFKNVSRHIGWFPGLRAPNSDRNPNKILKIRPHIVMYASQAIVPSEWGACHDAVFAELLFQVIVKNNQVFLFSFYPEHLKCLLDIWSENIHETQWFDDHCSLLFCWVFVFNVITSTPSTHRIALTQLPGHKIHKISAHIVPGTRINTSRVAETHEQERRGARSRRRIHTLPLQALLSVFLAILCLFWPFFSILRGRKVPQGCVNCLGMGWWKISWNAILCV